MRIVDASPGDLAAAVLVLAAAFAADPLIAYFFRTHPEGVGFASRQFFSLPPRLRMTLGMPALVLKEDEKVLGVAMGYDTERPAWPEPFASEWTRLEADTPGFADRLEFYEALSRSHEPEAPHYYLGRPRGAPGSPGQGRGKALLESFCRKSAADPMSSGVYLDTGNPSSLKFHTATASCFAERTTSRALGSGASFAPMSEIKRGADGLQSIVASSSELDKLKGVTRKTRPLGLERYENSAEHSWQIALLAASLVHHAPRIPRARPHDDLDRVIRMLLVHDIGEIDTGDTMVYAAGGWEERKAAEPKRRTDLQPAARTAGHGIPRPVAGVRGGVPPEARFANAVDRAMPVLLNLANEGQSWRENGISHERVIGRVAAPIRDGCPALWEYLEERLEEERLRGWFGAAEPS